MKGRFFYVLLLILVAPCLLAKESGLEQVRQWQRNGAYELALQTLNSQQPAAAQDYAAWQRWERQRFSLYRDLGIWDSILERYNALPVETRSAFRQWAEIQAVHAYLHLEQNAEALSLAQRRLWARGDQQVLQLWRAMVIQIYAAMHDEEAVITAWRRFSQDAGSGPSGNAESLLAMESGNALRAYARILIRRERYAEAVRELANDGSIDGRLLYAAAQLLVNAETAEAVYGLTRQMAGSDGATPQQRRRALILMARAAGRRKQYSARVDALVRALLIPSRESDQDSLFTASADDLWSAYEEWGYSLGQAAGLRANYENEWASALEQGRKPAEQVALASVLVLNGRSPQSREQASEALLATLPELDFGARQTLWLLADSERLRRNFVGLPDKLQRAALRAALREADLQAVRRLLESRGPVADPLKDQADGVLYVHARLLMGEPAPANRFLSEGLDNLSAWFPGSQVDLLTLLRDLQGGGYHAPVALAGEKLARSSGDRKLRIQAAEYASRSMIETGQYQAAAKLSLSLLAESPDAEANDLALLAYEALWRAKLMSDAEQLWHRKLSAPEVRERAADLKRRLQAPSAIR